MRLGVPKETVIHERRVALTPDVCSALAKAGWEILVETGAGAGAYFSEADYQKAGARTASTAETYAADAVVKLHRPSAAETAMLREGGILVAFLYPGQDCGLIDSLVARSITSFAMELVPRITRAQKMDALSSQASVAGYKAVLLAASSLGRYFPMLTTAAGTITPSKVLVLGAGVAGLQAIATARRLGAVVWAYDVRPTVKEQVESLGAKFLDLGVAEQNVQDKGGYARELSEESKQKQQAALGDKTKDFDVVITTALIPGRPAPRLITAETVARMKPGSVIVDLAAEAGGNCELTEADSVVVKHEVTIHGPLNLASTVPVHASQLYAKNVAELISVLVKDGKWNIDLQDEIIQGCCVTHAGRKLK